MTPRQSALLFSALLLPATALANDYPLDDVRVSHPFATPTPPGAPNGAVYLDISVRGDSEATLVDARTPASGSVELHDMRMDDGNMQMRKLDEVVIEPGETVSMRPGGGPHLMLLGLDEALREGESFPLELDFAKRGTLDVEVEIRQAEEGSETADAHHEH